MQSRADTGPKSTRRPASANIYSIVDDVQTGGSYTYYRGTACNAETGRLGEYVPCDQLDTLEYVTPTQSTIMARYLVERSVTPYDIGWPPRFFSFSLVNRSDRRMPPEFTFDRYFCSAI